MLLVIPVLFAEMFVNGLAVCALGVVAYLWWLGFREKRQRRAQEVERDRRRREYWGEP